MLVLEAERNGKMNKISLRPVLRIPLLTRCYQGALCQASATK